MGHLQPSRVTSRVTSSQKWRTSSPPVTFVRNRVLYVKFLPKFSARAARSLAMQIRKSHPESHPCKIQRTQVTSDHIQQSHPGKIQRPVTSEWSHPQSHPDKIQSLPGGSPSYRRAAAVLYSSLSSSFDKYYLASGGHREVSFNKARSCMLSRLNS